MSKVIINIVNHFYFTVSLLACLEVARERLGHEVQGNYCHCMLNTKYFLQSYFMVLELQKKRVRLLSFSGVFFFLAIGFLFYDLPLILNKISY